ncbi:MAG: class I SAM-dependent methyltransferase [Actinomycetota bacterium]|nr:class I SAM-dependent methyltransferase [Actinomycetota bacterium]
MAFAYDVAVDANSGNNAHAFMLGMVGFNKSVLEVGCAAGHVTKVLAQRGCTVVGLERDPAAARSAATWARRVVVGDVEDVGTWAELGEERYGAVMLGDVLEHLRDPLAALRRAVGHVAPGGMVVISLPNIAHGDVRMALLRGAFPYRETGLLDRTHLRFFTRETMRELCAEAGLVIVDTKRVVMPLFQTELGVIRDDFDQTLIDGILEDPEAETYQFVVQAVVDNGDHAVVALADRLAELSDHVHHEGVRRALLLRDLRERAEMEEEIRWLRRSLEEAEGRYAAILGTKTFRLVAPLRRLYGMMTRPEQPGSRPAPKRP